MISPIIDRPDHHKNIYRKEVCISNKFYVCLCFVLVTGDTGRPDTGSHTRHWREGEEGRQEHLHYNVDWTRRTQAHTLQLSQV